MMPATPNAVAPDLIRHLSPFRSRMRARLRQRTPDHRCALSGPTIVAVSIKGDKHHE